MLNRLSMLARGVSQSTQFVPRVRPCGARKARGLRDKRPFGGPNEKRAAKARIHYIYGGEGGIRTRGELLAPTRFPGVRLKPLIHLSGADEFSPRASVRGLAASREARGGWC